MCAFKYNLEKDTTPISNSKIVLKVIIVLMLFNSFITIDSAIIPPQRPEIEAE